MKSLTNFINENKHAVNERRDDRIQFLDYYDESEKRTKQFLNDLGDILANYNWFLTFGDLDKMYITDDDDPEQPVIADIDLSSKGVTFGMPKYKSKVTKFLKEIDDVCDNYGYDLSCDEDVLYVSMYGNPLVEISEIATGYMLKYSV